MKLQRLNNKNCHLLKKKLQGMKQEKNYSNENFEIIDFIPRIFRKKITEI